VGGKQRRTDRGRLGGRDRQPLDSERQQARLAAELREARARIAELEEEQADLLRGLAAAVRAERRMEALWGAPLDLSLVLDTEGRVLKASDSAAARLGGSADALIGKSIWDHVAPSVVEGRRALAEKVVRTGRSARMEDEHDGVWFDSAVFPIFDANGTVIELGVISSDISERKRAEIALRESEERYRAVAENALAGIGVSDQDENLVFVNVSFAAMLGYQVEELVGMNLGDLVDERELARFQQFTELRKNNVRNRYATKLRRKDGTWAHLEVSAAPMRDESGTFQGTLAVILDITNRQQYDAALRESEERYRAVAENALAGIGISDERENLVYANHSFAAMLGYRQEEIVGLNLRELVDADELARFQRLTALRKEGVQNRYETRLRRKDGSLAHLEVSAAPMWDSNGKFIGTLAVLLDMTERIRAEEERRELEAQIQHAEKLKSLGVMAGGIAHDFNNLLASILGNAEIALHDLGSDSAVRAPVTDILQAARRAADLTKQMLAYSGKSRMVSEEIDLATLVRELHALLQSIVTKKVALELDLAGDLPAVEADPSQLRQVVMNLVANASEAIGEDSGTVVVRTSVTRCDRALLSRIDGRRELREGLYVTLEVEDSGSGMNTEIRNRMFEPFFTTKFPGRGLGLASVHGILRAHQGAIDVETAPGKGTVVRAYLPALDHAVHEQLPVEPVEDEWRGSGTVLIVDDEAVVRRVADRMVRRLGFGSLLARDGAEALEVYESNRDDIVLVLLDLAMPVMDGEEAFLKLRCLRGDLPVLLSSGYSEEHAARRFAGQGLSGFIQKPYRMAALRERVRAALGE